MTGKGWTCPYSLALGEPTLCALRPLASNRGVTMVTRGRQPGRPGSRQESRTVTWKVPAPTGQQRGLLSQGWGASQRASGPDSTGPSQRPHSPLTVSGHHGPPRRAGACTLRLVPQSSGRKASAGDGGEQKEWGCGGWGSRRGAEERAGAPCSESRASGHDKQAAGGQEAAGWGRAVWSTAEQGPGQQRGQD